jgi:hypothetical protein
VPAWFQIFLKEFNEFKAVVISRLDRIEKRMDQNGLKPYVEETMTKSC